MTTTTLNTLFERYILVGCGGVGTHLEPLLRYLAYKRPGSEVVLIDGDYYEEKNMERQIFSEAHGNKAEVKAVDLSRQFPTLSFKACPEYVTGANVDVLIPEKSVVFSAVDNHPSRMLISDRMLAMEDGVLISGGNDYSDGNVQIHIRMGGENVTPPITYMHPEINYENGKHPAALSCEEQAQVSSPQLVLANNMVASLMAGTYWRLEQALEKAAADNIPLDFPNAETYFDLVTGAARPVRRIMEKEPINGNTEDREIGIDESGTSGRVEAGSQD